MDVITFPLGDLQANCYLLVEDGQCLIVDPGDEASFILEELQRRNLKLVGMLATHGHFDHIMAAGEIQLSINIPLYIFKEDQFLIDRIGETAKHFLGYEPHVIKPLNIKYLKEGGFEISNLKFQIISTPGHTPGSSSFYFQEEGSIFTGDTLFKQGIGRYDHSYSDKEKLKKSLQKLIELPSGTIVYPGHQDNTLIANEQNILELYPL